MMMRRSAVRFAAAAAAAGPAVGSPHSIQTIEKGVDAAPNAENAAAPETQHAVNTHVHTARLPPAAFTPSAIEAPERLQSYVETKPFVSARRIQVFTVSMGVGAVSVGLVYFFLSKSISTRMEEEQMHLDRVAERNRLAMQDRMSVMLNFTAPSSYDELYAKMVEREKEVEAQLAQSRSTLHTETMYHLKMWWNRCLRNIQAATDYFTNAQLRRKEAQAEANIKTTLQYNGYELIELKKI
ncbi:hypothetical protein ABL78_0191 [Leptomonas seymouri]|uniref:Transmembrane protein n=1 Tax=Leptomonas seymouri TaxID=5684 RepID=A0A0N1IMV6_LEPSE|nr:hypothetical protein ABL78_0191 [Leptomonas seymouri]|eukprot:KPI90755.1 hypothetical protein ABL78_0191 [Leptomonas seymouri]